MILRLVTLSALLVVGSLHAAPTDPAATDASPTASAAGAPVTPAPVVQTVEEEKVCRMERTIGSNRSKRVCRTKSQLEREKLHAQDQLANPARGG
jgi:hypothetical protein